jgi:hypothetical protein
MIHQGSERLRVGGKMFTDVSESPATSVIRVGNK